MNPFRDYRQVLPATRCRPADRCAVCRRQPAQLLREFDAIVRGSWAPAEVEILIRAAHSALL